MTTLRNRDKLLAAGRRLMLAQGYAGSSVRSIADAAGLPLSSVHRQFGSKEALGLAVLELYFAEHQQLMHHTLRNDALPPPLRLRRYFSALLPDGASSAACGGCLMGKLCAEAQVLGLPMRARLAGMLGLTRCALAYCLSAASDAGFLPPHCEADELAAFMLASLQGAWLLVRMRRDSAALLRCQQQLLQMLGWPTHEAQDWPPMSGARLAASVLLPRP